jgi:hypothetical protein
MISNRSWFYLYLLAISCWFILGINFHMERLYGDAAFYLFNCINDLELFIAHGRPAGVITQLIPLFLAKGNSEMSTLIASFTLSETLWTLLITILPGLFYRDWKLSFFSIFPYFLGVVWNFFNPVSEFILTSPVFIIANAVLLKDFTSLRSSTAYLALTIFCLLNHPLYYIMVPVVYIFICLKIKPTIKQVLNHILILGVVIMVKLLTSDTYDQHQMSIGNHNSFLDNIQTYFQIDNIFLVIRNYWSNMICFILLLICLWKGFKLLLYFVLTSVLLLWCGTSWKFNLLFPDTFEPWERYIFLIPVIISLFMYAIELKVNKYVLLLIFPLIVITHSILIWNYGKGVSIRKVQLLNVIEYAQSNKISKVLVRYNNFNPWHLGHNWSLTGESLLYSRTIGNRQTVQVAVLEAFDPALLKEIQPWQYVHFPWWAIDQRYLNPEYFYLYNQPFYLLNNTEPNNLSIEPFLNSTEVSVITDLKSTSKYKKSIEILVNCRSLNYFPSSLGGKKVMLVAKWVYGDTIIDAGDAPLLLDLKGNFKQLFRMKCPDKPGSYKLQWYLSLNDQQFKLVNSDRQYNFI